MSLFSWWQWSILVLAWLYRRIEKAPGLLSLLDHRTCNFFSCCISPCVPITLLSKKRIPCHLPYWTPLNFISVGLICVVISPNICLEYMKPIYYRKFFFPLLSAWHPRFTRKDCELQAHHLIKTKIRAKFLETGCVSKLHIYKNEFCRTIWQMEQNVLSKRRNWWVESLAGICRNRGTLSCREG